MSSPTIDTGNSKILRSTAILSGVSDPTIGNIAAIARPQTIEEGETLYSVGDPARSAQGGAARPRRVAGTARRLRVDARSGSAHRTACRTRRSPRRRFETEQ